MEINIENVKAAYKEADAAEKKKLRSLFLDFDKIFPVTERIKTLVDAIRELGSKHPFVENLADLKPGDENLTAFAHLRIICAALNDGCVTKPEDGGFSPKFIFHTADEVKAMNDDIVRHFIYVLEPRFDTDLVAVSCPCATFSRSGSCLLLRTPELALYCGQQFIDIWMNYLLPIKKDD